MSEFENRAVTVQRTIAASPDQVWAVLSDGWLYPNWVVGAARMRDVDAHWPEPGARLHHSVGNWPFLLDDRSEVLEAHSPAMLRLRAHGWPAGAAEVLIEIEAQEDGSLVTIREDAVQGPAVLVPRPARQAAIVARNREALLRLAYLAENRVA